MAFLQFVNAASTCGTGYDVWPSWCTTGTTTNVSIINDASTTIIWSNWTCTTTTSSTNIVWNSWIDLQGQTIPFHQAPVPTAEQRRAYAAASEARRKKAEEEVQQHKAAAVKAMELLRENFTKKQREALAKRNWFLVQGGKSKKTYRVEADRCAGNIYELDDKGEAIARYCVHAEYHIPLGDQLLTQAISLRLDEEHLMRTANKTVLHQAA